MEVCHIVNLADHLSLAPEQAGHPPYVYVYTNDAGAVVASLTLLPLTDPDNPCYRTHVHAVLAYTGQGAERIYGLHYAPDGHTRDTNGKDYGRA